MRNAFPTTPLPQLVCTTVVSRPLGKAVGGSANRLTAVNIVTDIILAVLPVPLVWNLQLSKRAKTTLIVILGLGFLYAYMLADVVCLAAR